MAQGFKKELSCRNKAAVVDICNSNTISTALGYLIFTQNPDGGFGSGSSALYETALAFEAAKGKKLPDSKTI
jgi:hypothetical protein